MTIYRWQVKENLAGIVRKDRTDSRNRAHAELNRITH